VRFSVPAFRVLHLLRELQINRQDLNILTNKFDGFIFYVEMVSKREVEILRQVFEIASRTQLFPSKFSVDTSGVRHPH